MEFIKKIVVEALNNYINGVISDGIALFLKFVAGISETSITVLNLPVVVSGILVSQAICLAILAPKVVTEAITTYILRMNGEPSADPTQLLIGTIQSVAVISCLPWLIRYVILVGTTATADVAAMPGNSAYGVSDASSFQEVFDAMTQQVTMTPVFLALAVVVALILVMIVVVQVFIRAGEIALASVVGAFMSLGFTNRTSAFGTWLKELIALSLAPALQMFEMRVAFESLHAVTFSDPWYSFFLFAGILWVTIKTPAILKQYAHATGIGGVAGGAVQQTISARIMRSAVTKGI